MWEVDTYAHVLTALGRTEDAVVTFLHAAELGGPEERRGFEESLRRLGFDPDEVAFKTALQACAATGVARRLGE